MPTVRSGSALTHLCLGVSLCLSLLGGCVGHAPAKPTATPARMPACPDDLRTRESQPLTLPRGAVAMRICRQGAAGRLVAPPDVVTTRVDDWIDTYNSMDEWTGQGCPPRHWMWPGPPGEYEGVLLSYPDGHTSLVSGPSSNCGVLGKRGGYYELVRQVFERLDEQRRAGIVPVVDYEPCLAGGTVLQPGLEDVDAAFICPAKGAGTPRRLSSEQTERLVRGLEALMRHSQATDSIDRDPGRSHIRLYAATGEFRWLQRDAAGKLWFDSPNGPMGALEPEGDLSGLLDELPAS